MTKHSSKRRRPSRAERKPLVSSFSILILSAFLIVSVASRLVIGELQHYAMIVGVAGLLSFIGLDQVRTWRRRRALAAEQQHIEERLEKHVDRSSSNLGRCLDGSETNDCAGVLPDTLQAVS